MQKEHRSSQIEVPQGESYDEDDQQKSISQRYCSCDS
jgi:hypothetical protein